MQTHLRSLEAEAIHIFREVAAECTRPILLYSIGKDSSVLLHLALKAFWPGKPPFPLLHVDTGWKFREMIDFRDATATRLGLDLRVHTNREGREKGISPITHGSSAYTDVMKTVALRQALDEGRFDCAIGGGRRDEERSRAKERIFSIRGAGHRWDPKAQRPELWRLYNTLHRPGETLRVFPISNWTATVLALGALAGALNTMYNAIASRAVEIATLRAIGFSGMPAFLGIMVESVCLALLGGSIGAGATYLLFDGLTTSTLGQNMSQVVFSFNLTPKLALQGLLLALSVD